jgi:hypothetical protein
LPDDEKVTRFPVARAQAIPKQHADAQTSVDVILARVPSGEIRAIELLSRSVGDRRLP